MVRWPDYAEMPPMCSVGWRGQRRLPSDYRIAVYALLACSTRYGAIDTL
jgi:hypothetical protein